MTEKLDVDKAHMIIKERLSTHKGRAIDFSNIKGFTGCFPLYSSAVPPHDQPNCISQKCEYCDEPMWVSEKKRALGKQKNVVVACYPCILTNMKKNGMDLPSHCFNITTNKFQSFKE